MTIFAKIIIFSLMIIYIIEYSGFVESIDFGLQKLLGSRLYHLPKPFSCGKCSVLWGGLFICLISHSLSWITIGFTFLLSFLEPQISALMFLFQCFIDKLTEQMAILFDIK